MAVRTTAASSRVAGTLSPAGGPIRTCIGCRTKAAAAELLRVVVAKTSSGSRAETAVIRVVPDPDRSAPGRGAWLHPVPACAQLAQRRRAYARALRVPEPVDPTPVLTWLGSDDPAV